MTSVETSSARRALTELRAQARGVFDRRHYGGSLGRLWADIEDSEAAVVSLNTAIVEHAEPALVLEAPPRPTVACWTGTPKLFQTASGAWAAYVRAIDGEPFRGAARVQFFGTTPSGLFLAPASVIVDPEYRPDLLRVASGSPPARDADAAVAAAMDAAGVRVGGAGDRYRVRVAPDGAHTVPAVPPVDVGDAWRTWPTHELAAALAATAVEYDALPRCSKGGRIVHERAQGLVVQFGPQTALRVLSTLHLQRLLN